jgi:hypothetical protein
MQNELEARCQSFAGHQSFALIHDVANSIKHLSLRPDRGRTDMTGAGDVHVYTAGSPLDWIGVGPGGMRLGGQVILIHPGNAFFKNVAADVYQMWTDFFTEHGW